MEYKHQLPALDPGCLSCGNFTAAITSVNGQLWLIEKHYKPAIDLLCNTA